MNADPSRAQVVERLVQARQTAGLERGVVGEHELARDRMDVELDQVAAELDRARERPSVFSGASAAAPRWPTRNGAAVSPREVDHDAA